MDLIAVALFYVVIWAVVFMVAVPINLQTQDESGAITPGTTGGSPQRHDLKKKAWITTFVALGIWVAVAWVILAGHVTLSDIDLFTRFGPGPIEERGLGG